MGKSLGGLVIKKCKRCGRSVPMSMDRELCFSCMADDILNGNDNKKEVNMAKKKICKKCGREMSIYAKGLCAKCYKDEFGKLGKAGLKVVIDFSDHPKLYKELQDRAKKEFRDIQHQILWCIQQCLKEVQ